VGCNPKYDAAKNWSSATHKIGMVTDTGHIDDRSFNQGTWEGIVDFVKANEGVAAAKYLQPASNEANTASYIALIENLISDGANVIVTPGFLFEPAIYVTQTNHPNVKFILIDGQPHSEDYSDYKTASNTISIIFQEEQSGFLAGYAAVYEGYTKLGFIGGMAVPAVERFGMGYVAGAYLAAKEKGVTLSFPANRYQYAGNFSRNPENITTASSWYSSGTEVIFAAAGSVNLDVFDACKDAAEAKRAIGVDVDQSGETSKVITSAMKRLGVAVVRALNGLLDNTFDGGKDWNLGAVADAIGLPQGDSFRFKTFTTAQYEAVLAKLKNGTIVVPNDLKNPAQITAYVTALNVAGVDSALFAKILNA
jgi:basic membrane protein A